MSGLQIGNDQGLIIRDTIFLQCRTISNLDSSALLVTKAHQQNTWETIIFRSLDFCYALTVRQDQKASLLQPVEFYWLVKGQKRAQGIGAEGLHTRK